MVDFDHKKMQAIINYGSSWCSHCHKLFPHYIAMTREFPALRFAVAQVDYMQESIKDIQLTPTIAVYKRGRKVDQFYGSDAQRLRDHLWLHSDV